MQSIQKPKSKKGLIITLIIIALAVIAAGAYVWFARPFDNKTQPTEQTTRPVNDVAYTPATDQEQKDSDAAKQKIIDQQKQQNNPPSQQSPISVTIVRANQASAGQPLTIRTQIEGATAGTCTATLTNNGQTATGSGTITFNATTYSCNVDIAASALTSGGQRQLNITATNGTATSPAATQNVTITK